MNKDFFVNIIGISAELMDIVNLGDLTLSNPFKSH